MQRAQTGRGVARRGGGGAKPGRGLAGRGPEWLGLGRLEPSGAGLCEAGRAREPRYGPGPGLGRGWGRGRKPEAAAAPARETWLALKVHLRFLAR